MEIDEKLSYSLFVALFLLGLASFNPPVNRSLQFDPAPRAGEPLVSRRVPDYFLVAFPYFASGFATHRYLFVSKHFTRRTRVLYIQHDTTTSCSPNRSSPIYLSLEERASRFVVHGHGSHCGTTILLFASQQAQCYPLFHQCHDVMTCLGSCFIYGAWTLFTKKGRRLDTEIKRTQNAPFHIPQTGRHV